MFNLGTGSGLSVRACVESALRLFNGFPVTVGARRPGDPALSYADPQRAKRELGWEARIRNVDTMLASMAPAYGLTVIK